MPFPKTIEELTAQGYKFENGATCKACHADIEWWTTPKGKKIPMDQGTADFRKPKAGMSTREALDDK